MRPEEKQIILDYVFKSDSNTLLALKVLEVRAGIRETVIENFLKCLVDRLRQELAQRPDWEVENDWRGRVLENSWKVWLEKKGWRGLYKVAVEPESKGPRQFILGVKNDWERLQRRADEGRIAGAMNTGYRNGRSSNWWPWYFSILPPYSDWTALEALERLHMNQGSDAVEYFARELIEVAQIAAPTIDREVAALGAAG